MSIIISKQGKDAVKIDQQDFDKENFLQDYIHNNPESIPVYEIDEDKRLFVVAREFGTESGPIDALAVDKDGDIYIVETKLFKNPDKRTVVAQALDYGAALWKHSGEFGRFLSDLDVKVRSKFNIGFQEKVKSFFNLTDEETGLLLEAMRRNLFEGNLKFVILMDTIDDRLKDLIVYVNQNSQFDIYAVQLEYYKHDDYEIMIPKMFGVEVKKNVSTNSASSPRKKWDEQSFFEDVRKNLDSEKAVSVKKLYDFAKQKSEIIWGTGMIRGAFSAQFDLLGTKPLFVLESNGILRISFDYPKKGASATQIAKMVALEPLISKTGLQVEKGANRTVFVVDEWGPKANNLIEDIKKICD